MKDKNYYDILGVTEYASDNEIKKAYYKLAQKIHPDKNDGDKFFEEYFKQIQEAYLILSNSTERDRYDRLKFGENFVRNKKNKENSEKILYEIKITINRKEIYVGAVFNLIYTINTDAKEIKTTSIEGLYSLHEPMRENSNNINKKITRFMLPFVAEKAGIIIIPSFKIIINDNLEVSAPQKKLNVLYQKTKH